MEINPLLIHLLTKNYFGAWGAIAFETNVTKISNVDIWFDFDLFENEVKLECRFLKGDKKPMILNCLLTKINYENNIFSLKLFKSEFINIISEFNQ